MSPFSVLILLAAAFGLAACTVARQPAKFGTVGGSSIGPADGAAGGHLVTSGPYRLDSGDSVRVTVFEQPALSNTYAVDQSGFIAMPLIGQVPARGRSTTELQSSIHDKLAARYLRDPDIAVEVSEYRPFFVHGAVRSGGRFPYSPGMTVETAIAVAGGFADRASTRVVRVSRLVNGGKQETVVLISDPIRPGDTIFVPAQPLH